MTVNELRDNPRLEFNGVELLTLSACQTAVVGKDSSGKEIEGFGYVAQQKGAKAILATLWNVADESTQLLMSEFYRLRKIRPQMTKVAALQLAQERMMQGQLRPATPRTRQRGLSILGDDFAYDPKRPYAHLLLLVAVYPNRQLEIDSTRSRSRNGAELTVDPLITTQQAVPI